jgi:hypothetical protein
MEKETENSTPPPIKLVGKALDSTVPIYPLIHHPNPPILRVV